MRRYYLLDGAIVVVRNGHELGALVGRIVDAAAGWDVAQAGFCKEEDIGKRLV